MALTLGLINADALAGSEADERVCAIHSSTNASFPFLPLADIRTPESASRNTTGWHLAGATALALLQTLLIAAFVAQHAKRRRVDAAVSASLTALQLTDDTSRQLARRLITAQDAARTRLARDLHDDVCQRIAVMALALADVKRRIDERQDARAVETVKKIQARTIDLANTIRHFSHQLHPGTLGQRGLVAALEALCEEVERRHDVQVSLQFKGEPEHAPPDVARCLFRICQEALRNAATHGQARQISVALAATSGVCELAVTDDGVGFDLTSVDALGCGLGLVSMEERARLLEGDVQVLSSIGHGTTVQARVPLPSPAPHGVDPGNETAVSNA